MKQRNVADCIVFIVLHFTAWSKQDLAPKFTKELFLPLLFPEGLSTCDLVSDTLLSVDTS
jgi:hypothetical protein